MVAEWLVVMEVGPAFELNFRISPSSIAILGMPFLVMILTILQVQGF
jgi:hypothetical protein